MPSNDTVPMTIRIPLELLDKIDDARRWAKKKRSAMAVELIELGLQRDPEFRNSGKKEVFLEQVVEGKEGDQVTNEPNDDPNSSEPDGGPADAA